MNKTYLKIIFSEIKKSFGRFIAIFAIVALGIGFLAGLLMATPDMHASVDALYDKSNMADIFIKSTMGITGADIKAVSSLDYVKDIMPAYVTDTLMKTSGNDVLATRVYGLPLNAPVNKLVLIDGRMPQAENECLVEQSGGYLSSISIGTTLTISDENDNYENIGDIYNVKSYKVVGIVSNPFYFSMERESVSIGSGRLGAVMYVSESCYSLEAYTDLYITVTGAFDLTAFTNKYETSIKDAVKKLESTGNAQSLIRYNEIIDIATSKLDKAKVEYAAAKKEALLKLYDAQEKINDGKNEISAGERKIRDAEKKLSAGRTSLEKERSDYYIQISSQETALKSGEAKLLSSKKILSDSIKMLDEAKPQIDSAKALRDLGVILPEDVLLQIAQYDAGMIAFDNGMMKVAEEEKKLASGKIEIAKAKEQAEAGFISAETKLEKAQKEIIKGKADLVVAKAAIADAEVKLKESKAEADKKLADGANEIADAQKNITKIEKPKWYVLDRNANVSYVSFSENSKKVAAIATVFPIFFLLIAALIALTTMTRMVEEERTQIGTLKALGYSKSVIMYKYIAYCGTASLLGSIIGLTAGFALLPGIIWNAYAFSYHLPVFIAQFNIVFALIATALAILCTVGATVFACYHALKEKPASLMLPRAPKAGKRIFLERIHFIWSKLKFSHKATARNLIRNKKHFFLTVIGIAGCTALILTGFGLRDSVGSIANTQFNKIIRYNLIIEKKDTSDPDSIKVFLNDPSIVKSYLEISDDSGHAINKDENIETSVYVPKDPSKFNEYILLNNRTSGKAIGFNDNAVVVTEKLASALKIKTGSTFKIENTDGKTADFILTGITENYVGSYIYIHPAEYARAFGSIKSYDTYLVKSLIRNSGDQDAFLTSIIASGDISNAEFVSQTRKSYDDLLSTMDFVVLVLIFAAGALAVIVLYNLTNININERRKELATLRVLGFHNKEVGAYIFRETSILTIVGAAAGLLLGVLLHFFVITRAESTDLMFGRNLSALSFILSAAFTFLFSIIVNLIMYKKLKKIEMVDSMKAID
ncbi:MAG: FtsX-like permease family protein [Saccharofermentanales bacterium]